MKDNIYNIFENFRNAQKVLIKEEEKTSYDAIPYGENDVLFKNSIEKTKNGFNASYTNFKTPMLYHSDGDVTLSGEITTLNNAKFQFRLNDPSGEGCYVWVSPILLNDEVLKTLQQVYGTYLSWVNDIKSENEYKPIGSD